MNYIRLLAGLRGGFQKGIAGWRLRLTQPTKPPTCLLATRTVGPRKRNAAGHSWHRGNSLRRPFHFEQPF